MQERAEIASNNLLKSDFSKNKLMVNIEDIKFRKIEAKEMVITDK